MATGQEKTITHRSKYFSPDISEDGKTIVAVDARPGMPSHLHLLDAFNGALVKGTVQSRKLLLYLSQICAADNSIVTAVPRYLPAR